MAIPKINQNFQIVRDPDLNHLLDLYKKESDLDFSCHHLATIQSFNSENQTVTVTINYKQTYVQFETNSQKYVQTLQDYPIIQDCPLIVLGGGKARITFPVNRGDQCILLFNDRDMDTWFQGSTTSPNSTPRLHSFSDCVALIGPNNLNTVISDYDPIRALITNGNVKNGINAENNKLTLQNNITTLNTLLQNLCTQLENLNTQLSILTVTGVSPGSPTDLSGPPSNAAQFVTIKANITAIATQIGGLIE